MSLSFNWKDKNLEKKKINYKKKFNNLTKILI